MSGNYNARHPRPLTGQRRSVRITAHRESAPPDDHRREWHPSFVRVPDYPIRASVIPDSPAFEVMRYSGITCCGLTAFAASARRRSSGERNVNGARIRDSLPRCSPRRARQLLVRGPQSFDLLSALRIAVLSEWAVARAALPDRKLVRGRRQLHRHLFRLANEESMRNRQHESLFSVEVGESDHTTSPLQEPERLPIPASFHLQEVPEAAAYASQLLCPLLILLQCLLVIRFFPGQFDGQINVTQPLCLGFQHAAEKNYPGYLGQEVRVLVDLRHALKKLRQGSFCGRAGDRLGRRG